MGKKTRLKLSFMVSHTLQEISWSLFTGAYQGETHLGSDNMKPITMLYWRTGELRCNFKSSHLECSISLLSWNRRYIVIDISHFEVLCLENMRETPWWVSVLVFIFWCRSTWQAGATIIIWWLEMKGHVYQISRIRCLTTFPTFNYSGDISLYLWLSAWGTHFSSDISGLITVWCFQNYKPHSPIDEINKSARKFSRLDLDIACTLQ